MPEFPETIWQVMVEGGEVYDLSEEQCAVVEELLFKRECQYEPAIDIHGEMWYVGNEIYGNEIRIKLSAITSLNQSTSESRRNFKQRNKEKEEWEND